MSQKFDKLIGWTLETLCSRCWNTIPVSSRDTCDAKLAQVSCCELGLQLTLGADWTLLECTHQQVIGYQTADHQLASLPHVLTTCTLMSSMSTMDKLDGVHQEQPPPSSSSVPCDQHTCRYMSIYKHMLLVAKLKPTVHFIELKLICHTCRFKI